MNEHSPNDDVTAEFTPTERLAIHLAQAVSRGGYCLGWVPRWTEEMYRREAVRAMLVLKEFGVTDDMLRGLDAFKEQP